MQRGGNRGPSEKSHLAEPLLMQSPAPYQPVAGNPSILTTTPSFSTWKLRALCSSALSWHILLRHSCCPRGLQFYSSDTAAAASQPSPQMANPPSLSLRGHTLRCGTAPEVSLGGRQAEQHLSILCADSRELLMRKEPCSQ